MNIADIRGGDTVTLRREGIELVGVVTDVDEEAEEVFLTNGVRASAKWIVIVEHTEKR